MIKVTARAQARAISSLSPILRFQSFKMKSGTRRVVVSWTRHTVPRPAVSGSSVVTERGGDNNTNPNRLLDATKRNTRRVVPVPNVC